MQGSQLQLDNYWIEEFTFSLDEDYEFDPKTDDLLTPELLNVEVEPYRNPDNSNQWYFRLKVSLKDNPGSFPYKFSIVLIGFFEIKKETAASFVEQLALVNSPSILYAAARELLAMISGRSRYLSLILPAVSFYTKPKTAKETSEGKPTAAVRKRAKRPVAVKK